mmetsp:Transcript_10846/g.20483  ORF Transcript_10846/g.20483 Transcript_10846/m.20483 type:complete len:80 (-) Transcript_10846:399-638(-)
MIMMAQPMCLPEGSIQRWMMERPTLEIWDLGEDAKSITRQNTFLNEILVLLFYRKLKLLQTFELQRGILVYSMTSEAFQ